MNRTPLCNKKCSLSVTFFFFFSFSFSSSSTDTDPAEQKKVQDAVGLKNEGNKVSSICK